MNPGSSEVTHLLAAWSSGDKHAFNQLMPLVYAELHRIARHAWNGQEPNNLQIVRTVVGGTTVYQA